MRLVLLAATAVAASLLVAGPTAADNPQLVGTVGPGYTISLRDGSGSALTHVDPGTYTLVVHDLADIHNFHLFGPGVDVATGVETTGDQTFTVTFAQGTYTFLCDAHPTIIHGTFAAGTVASPPPSPPPAAKAIAGRVGPGRTISFARSLAKGKYAITVRDLSAADNLHLKGPGVDRKTGVAFRGTVKWIVTLKAGTYRVGSDAHKTLGHAVTVS